MSYPTYRLGTKQQATLIRLNAALNGHPVEELKGLIEVALAANLPATALADHLGVSYSALVNWTEDPTETAQRITLRPKLVLLRKAISLGVAMHLFPTTEGEKIAPTLALLSRSLALRTERDEALATAAATRASFASFAADPETVASYDAAE